MACPPCSRSRQLGGSGQGQIQHMELGQHVGSHLWIDSEWQPSSGYSLWTNPTCRILPVDKLRTIHPAHGVKGCAPLLKARDTFTSQLCSLPSTPLNLYNFILFYLVPLLCANPFIVSEEVSCCLWNLLSLSSFADPFCGCEICRKRGYFYSTCGNMHYFVLFYGEAIFYMLAVVTKS